MSRAGEKTGKFGKWVAEYCQNHFPKFNVYYDHGDKEDDKEHVKVPMGHYGETVSRETRITDCDILVGLPGELTGKAVLLIEVEQGSESKTSGKRSVSPKTVLGDSLATMLCDGFAIKKNKGMKQKEHHEFYKVSENTRLLIAFPYNDEGYSYDKMVELATRIEGIQSANKLKTSNIRFEMNPSLDELLCGQLKERVIQMLTEYQESETTN